MSGAERSQEPACPLFPRWVLVLSAVVVLSTIVPHAYQAAAVPPGEHFTGIVEAFDDQNLYLSLVEQVRRGQVLVHDYHTAESAPPYLPSLPWLLMGLVARALPGPTIAIYHAVRLLWGFLLLAAIWALAREFSDDARVRTFAFLIAALGSGLGALADAVNAIAGRVVIFSADLMPELWAYHSLFVAHFPFVTALLALVALILLRAYRRPSGWLSLAAFATMLVLTLAHPYDLAVLGPLLVGHAVFCALTRAATPRALSANLWALAGALPPAAFLWWQTQTNATMAAWSEQNVLRSPPPHVYLLGFGLVLPLAIVGRVVLSRLRKETAGDWLVIFWPLVTAVAVYAWPLVPFERRCAEGVFLPLSLLAGLAVGEWLMPALRRRLPAWDDRRLAAFAMLLLGIAVLPTNAKLLVDLARTGNARIPQAWVEGFAWIERNTPADARFFTSHRTGIFLARYTLRHVYLGHQHLTLDAARKLASARRALAATTPAHERLAILRASGCGWVAANARQAEALRQLPGLEPVRDWGSLALFRIPDSAPPPTLVR
ncbi:MAG: hypothetical protein AB7Y46_00200 [Armatimonadota bacterium]